tara:strand:+ start:254 stop:1072 length:819 start_codon:yes stop_codon:yes gene_type:complete
LKTILDDIVARKELEVAGTMAARPLKELEAELADAPPTRGFATALRSEPGVLKTNVIAEIKRKSPSAGVIREDFDPIDIAKRYQDAGAKAISCLTDGPGFGGRLEYLKMVRDASSLPVLRKEFIIDPYQVIEARVWGADAVLLIAECLDDEMLKRCRDKARELGLSVLIELHAERNLERILELNDFAGDSELLLGINNRDLARMKTDLSRTRELLTMDVANDLERNGVVSESGIRTPEDLESLRGSGVRIVLVGEHLMRCDDPGAALKKLLS